MSNNKTCCICYNKNTKDNLKCKTCKNQVCDECYANIIFNNRDFPIDFKKDTCKYKCPFCKEINIFSSSINKYNTNNKLIKLLLQTMEKDNIEFNCLVDDINILRRKNYELQNELNEIKNISNSTSTDKLQELEKILNSSKNKNTILYKQIKSILI
jgi:hypothetical protein